MRRILFLFLVNSLFILGLISICFAQDTAEQLTITTYYPSPHGVYKTLRLFPNANSSVGLGKNCKSAGELTYASGEEKPLYCDGSKWQAISSGLEYVYSNEFIITRAGTDNGYYQQTIYEPANKPPVACFLTGYRNDSNRRVFNCFVRYEYGHWVFQAWIGSEDPGNAASCAVSCIKVK